MDVDHLTTEEQREHMQKGQCFVCHKIGHRARDHKNGRTPPETSRNNYRIQKIETPSTSGIVEVPPDGTGQKPDRTGLLNTTRIQALMASLSQEERTVAIKKMEEEGF
ncbi:hypothetical protein BD779DRAFT_1597442 [Infundibulicybe gibba]|nr:hypothetical protein BD779DRAFT_1597442 [Infundibulicybe gibba]